MKYLFYIYNKNHILEAVNDKNIFNYTDKIYVNYYTNITETIEISIRPNNSNNNNNYDESGLSTIYLVLIIIGSFIILLAILVIIYFIVKNKKKVTNEDFEGKIGLVPAE